MLGDQVHTTRGEIVTITCPRCHTNQVYNKLPHLCGGCQLMLTKGNVLCYPYENCEENMYLTIREIWIKLGLATETDGNLLWLSRSAKRIGSTMRSNAKRLFDDIKKEDGKQLINFNEVARWYISRNNIPTNHVSLRVGYVKLGLATEDHGKLVYDSQESENIARTIRTSANRMKTVLKVDNKNYITLNELETWMRQRTPKRKGTKRLHINLTPIERTKLNDVIFARIKKNIPTALQGMTDNSIQVFTTKELWDAKTVGELRQMVGLTAAT